MIITCFGATGMVGKRVVKQAILDGNHIKAFGRNVFTAGFPEADNIELIKGALFDEEEVFSALKGSDAVVSVLGGAADGSDHTRSYGMKIIAHEMQRAGIKRIITVAGVGILPVGNGEELMMDQKTFPAEFRPTSLEHLKAYETLKNSGLEWTVVCPPMIRDADETGLFHTTAEALPTPNRFSINSGDLALFLLKELSVNRYVHQRVGISN